MWLPFFVGTYSMPSPWAGAPDAHGAGVVAGAIDLTSGELTIGAATPAPDPAFIVVDSVAQRLWAITELGDAGELLSWSIDGTDLTSPTRLPTGAVGPGHVTIDLGRSLAYVTHFGGGRLAVVALDASGSPTRVVDLIELPRPRGSALVSRPHCSRILDDDLLLVTDFGRDLLATYRIHGRGEDARLELAQTMQLADGTAPRHIAARDGADVVYVSNENSASISVLHRDPTAEDPQLDLVQTAPAIGLGRARSLPAEIAIHPTIDVVYMANRRDESLSVFEIVGPRGELRERGAVDVRGTWPRHFSITPDGTLLVVGNQNTDTLESFRIADDGDLEWTGFSCAVASPASIAFSPGSAIGAPRG